MPTTFNHKRFIVRAAIAAMAAPTLLFLGAGTAQALPDISENNATTITTQRDGHIAIQVAPGVVSPPLVWGPFPSLEDLLAD